MGATLTASTQPALAAIKLAWWRERLEELDDNKIPAEPRLQAAHSALLTRGISGSDLAALEESWALILQADDVSAFARGIASRGPLLFSLAARVLGVELNPFIENASHAFVSADLARRNIASLPAHMLLPSKRRASSRDRPLTAFGALARRDLSLGGPPFEAEATPLRAWALLWHWLTGR